MRLTSLKPVKGTMPPFSIGVKNCKRPYIPITKEQYETLEAGEHDFYEYKGQKVTFGTADMGYALMPYTK